MGENENILSKIVERRAKDIEGRGLDFGFEIPVQRKRPVNPFMEKRGLILELKRASPSRGDIAKGLDFPLTAKKYFQNGATAISCLTEENYFKGSLKDLLDVCEAVPNIAVLRKDFLLYEEEVEISYRCGADAVLLISAILPFEKMLRMTQKCSELKIRAFIEVRTFEDVKKVLEVKNHFPETVVCGVNSRNLEDFSIDLLVPAMFKESLGGKVVFESGIKTFSAVKKIAALGFSGILMGEAASKNPGQTADFVKAFSECSENLYGKKMNALARKILLKKIDEKIDSKKPMIKICGLTRKEDVLLADSLGADFVGFVFAKEFERNVCGKKFDALVSCLKELKAFKVAVVTCMDSDEARFAINLVKEGTLDFVQFHGIDFNSVPGDILEEIPHFFAVSSKTEDVKKVASDLQAEGEFRFIQDDKKRQYEKSFPLWLAGGLAPENVFELVRELKPELIDVSGGIEDEGNVGVKNAQKMKAFFENALHGD